MINEIIDGIAIKLHETFGSKYKIYKEDVPQGFVEPCFVIRLVQPLQNAKLPNRYHRVHLFDIHYFPKSDVKAKTEIYEVADKLFSELEFITVKQNDVDNLCRGTKMRNEIVDNVLHFFVNYDFFVKIEVVEEEYMEELIQK